MNTLINKVVSLLEKSRKVTVLTGAGISAESGIPTYRGGGGIWNKFKMEDLAAPEAFEKNPKLVWQWYGERQETALQCEPNMGHRILVEMENFFPVFTLITQNVDNMHQRAGNKNIIELHGNLFKARCSRDCNGTGENAAFDFILKNDNIPTCTNCGALIRPHIVWFGEALDQIQLREAFQASVESDVFLVIGTSSQVQPAASLPIYAQTAGAVVIEINLEETQFTPMAGISLQGKSGDILTNIWNSIQKHDKIERKP